MLFKKSDIEDLLKLHALATPGPVTIKYEDLGDEVACWAPIEIIGANNFRIVAYDGGLAPDDEWQVETLEANAALILFAFNHAPEMARQMLAYMDVVEAAKELKDSYGKDAETKMRAWHNFVEALAALEGVK